MLMSITLPAKEIQNQSLPLDTQGGTKVPYIPAIVQIVIL